MAKRLSASAEKALSVIAHIAMARDLGKNVPGMSEFPAHYQKQLPAADRAVYARFHDLCRTADRDLAKLIERDMGKANG